MTLRTRTSTKLPSSALAWLIALALASACSNGVRRTVLKPQASTSTNSAQSSLITINNVIRNSQDPSGTIDILGDGSNSIGANCTSSSSGASSNSGATDCLCVFSYQKPDPANTSTLIPERLEVETTYHEGNLLRCRIDQIPSAVTSVAISVLVKTAESESNSLNLSLLTGAGTLDTSQSQSFSKVYRYTCRDKVVVFDPLDPESGIYDPIQSEDPRNSYPLSFYSTNIGATINAYAGGVAGIKPPTDWDCPANPLDPPDSYKVTIYSESPDTNGSNIISGGTKAGGLDKMNTDNIRSTFYLAKQKGGVFSIPVNAYIAPTIISNSSGPPSNSGGGLPLLGFGASPISQAEAGKELCPDDSVTIPTGFHWVKVWLFRMALPTRKSMDSPNLRRLGSVGCNPGPWCTAGDASCPDPAAAPAYPPVNWKVPDCYSTTYVKDTGTSDGGVASRFSASTGQCFKTTPNSSTVDGNFSLGGDPFGDPLSVDGLFLYPDKWIENAQDKDFKCGGNSPSPVASLLHSCDAANFTYDNAPVAINIDSNPAQVRYEFLFVVTPEDVYMRDMSDQTSIVRSRYTPFRFRVDSDCNLADPATCDFNKSFRNYGLKLHDVLDAGDPPAGSSTRPGVFPVCALQPDGLSP